MVWCKKKGACAENQPSQLEEDAWKMAACSGGECSPVLKRVCTTTASLHDVQRAAQCHLKEQCGERGDSLTQPLLGDTVVSLTLSDRETKG